MKWMARHYRTILPSLVGVVVLTILLQPGNTVVSIVGAAALLLGVLCVIAMTRHTDPRGSRKANGGGS
jgi:uncharacterized membrane protein HdeD (DUF308 family)